MRKSRKKRRSNKIQSDVKDHITDRNTDNVPNENDLAMKIKTTLHFLDVEAVMCRQSNDTEGYQRKVTSIPSHSNCILESQNLLNAKKDGVRKNEECFDLNQTTLQTRVGDDLHNLEVIHDDSGKDTKSLSRSGSTQEVTEEVILLCGKIDVSLDEPHYIGTKLEKKSKYSDICSESELSLCKSMKCIPTIDSDGEWEDSIEAREVESDLDDEKCDVSLKEHANVETHSSEQDLATIVFETKCNEKMPTKECPRNLIFDDCSHAIYEATENFCDGNDKCDLANGSAFNSDHCSVEKVDIDKSDYTHITPISVSAIPQQRRRLDQENTRFGGKGLHACVEASDTTRSDVQPYNHKHSRSPNSRPKRSTQLISQLSEPVDSQKNVKRGVRSMSSQMRSNRFFQREAPSEAANTFSDSRDVSDMKSIFHSADMVSEDKKKSPKYDTSASPRMKKSVVSQKVLDDVHLQLPQPPHRNISCNSQTSRQTNHRHLIENHSSSHHISRSRLNSENLYSGKPQPPSPSRRKTPRMNT